MLFVCFVNSGNGAVFAFLEFEEERDAEVKLNFKRKIKKINCVVLHEGNFHKKTKRLLPRF